MSEDEDGGSGAPSIPFLSRKVCLAAVMRRSILAPTLLILAYLILNGTSNIIFLRSSSTTLRKLHPPTHFPSASHQTSNILLAQPNLYKPYHPLRVYMYDLPRKFTYGVVENYLRSRALPWSFQRDEEIKYPGNQHSAEWWLFHDLEQRQGGRLSSSMVRVFQEEEADVFYVPFFSSLSLVVNGKVYSDEEMQEELMGWLEGQERWKRYGGRDHVIVCQDPNALNRLRERVKNAVLLVSDFGRFKPGEASLVKDVVVPYTHRINSYVNESAGVERKTLLFFMGNRYRKQGGKIRDQLFQILENEQDMVIKHGTQSRTGRRLAAEGMRTSKFCLHPAGDTPSACRLFDAIVSVCVPVIVSDDIELPFEDELDYSAFSIFVPSAKALEPGYLGSYLRDTSSESLERMQKRLREVRKYFEYEEKGGAVEMIWQQVQKKLPSIRLMINRDRRLVERSTANSSCFCTT